MRDPNRIPVVLERLEKVWEKHPDLRFGQLILNVLRNDFYHVEDEELVTKIELFYERIRNDSC
jgi:uncharacterized protein YihD (DUF1040 family)